MSKTSLKDVLFDPVFNRNPIGLLVLGICSALAITACGIGLAMTFVALAQLG